VKRSKIIKVETPLSWPEAEIVGLPESRAGEPRVLVRRKVPDIHGPNGEEMIMVPGAGQAISLFTGCGGMDLGLEQAGFTTVVQHEWDESCCQTLIANRPRAFRHSALIQGDICKTPTGMILREARLRVGEADLLTGGPPCQGFSTAGHRERNGPDARNNLIFQFLRVIDEAKPKFFIMENVPGLLSLKGGQYFHTFLERAYGCYYELVYGLVDAVEYGVPQYRCRFFCVGTRRDLHEINGTLGGLPQPQTFSKSDLLKIEIIQLIPALDEERQLLLHPPGIRYFPDRPVLIPPRPIGRQDEEGNKGRSGAFVEFYRRLRREEPDRIVMSPQEGRDAA
jgi:site-specific DNA-cytosine methylase